MHFWMAIFLFLVLIACSVWMRICHSRTIDSAKAKATPFSAAVQELVATAGGVYLSVIALTSFLRLDIPEKVACAGISFDPLALLAIFVAVTQPWWQQLFIKNND